MLGFSMFGKGLRFLKKDEMVRKWLQNEFIDLKQLDLVIDTFNHPDYKFTFGYNIFSFERYFYRGESLLDDFFLWHNISEFLKLCNYKDIFPEPKTMEQRKIYKEIEKEFKIDIKYTWYNLKREYRNQKDREEIKKEVKEYKNMLIKWKRERVPLDKKIVEEAKNILELFPLKEKEYKQKRERAIAFKKKEEKAKIKEKEFHSRFQHYDPGITIINIETGEKHHYNYYSGASVAVQGEAIIVKIGGEKYGTRERTAIYPLSKYRVEKD